MATSSTVAFNPSISEIIEEAYERCNIQLTSGYSLKTALFSLNVLFSEWGNRGIHFWEVANQNLYISEDQNVYDIYKDSTARDSSTTNKATYDNTNYVYNATDIITAAYRTDNGAVGQTDITLTKIDRSAYAALANKLSNGVPSQFWVERFINKTRITLYIRPGSSQAANHINIFYVKRIFDAGINYPNTGATDKSYSQGTDVPYRFYPSMIAGLAYYLSQKISPAKTQELRLYYEDEMKRALAEDGSASSTFITPQAYYPAIG